jgi:hypothetical protein
LTARRPVIEIQIRPPSEVRSVSFTSASYRRTQSAEVDATDCTMKFLKLAAVEVTSVIIRTPPSAPLFNHLDCMRGVEMWQGSRSPTSEQGS